MSSDINVNELAASSDHMFPYKFSIVMAVYMVEDYLEEAVESLINQTLDFKQNVQLILINDGSPDASGSICDSYKEKYPNNIVVVHKENGGLSSAHNAGLPFVEGRYVNFLDSDDKISENTLEIVYDFFVQNDERVDVVAIPEHYFGRQSGPNHSLNKKFSRGSRVIDLIVEYRDTQHYAIARSFIKQIRAKEMCFDTEILHAMDAKEIQKVLVHKQRLGVVRGCIYYYRKRVTQGNPSIIDTAHLKKGYYTSYLQLFSLFIYDYYKERLGYIPHHVMRVVLYDIQWKIRHFDFPLNVLTEEEKAEFFSCLTKVLQQTDDEIILGLEHIWIEHKLFLMFLKYGKEPSITLRQLNACYHYGNTKLFWLTNANVTLHFMNLTKTGFILEGEVNLLQPCLKNLEILLCVNEQLIDSSETDTIGGVMSLGNVVSTRRSFKFTHDFADVSDEYKLRICLRLQNYTMATVKNIKFGPFMPISKDIANSYYFNNGLIALVDHSSLIIRRSSMPDRFLHELKFLKVLMKLRREGAKKAIAVRLFRHAIMPFLKRDIWLISDRVNKADDNGEALFRYISSLDDNEINCFFCIDEGSSDFKRMKQFGKVIPLRGIAYKMKSLLGATLISSHADDNVHLNPLKWSMPYYRDLMADAKRVFLQHGITENDISGWLNRFRVNFDIFIAAANFEYESFFEDDYFYTEKQVHLTGFPRHDKLYNDTKRMITIMPTWRISLTHLSRESMTRIPIDDFINSTYYNFYNDLLSNNFLLEGAKNSGYRLGFCIHPNMRTALDQFEFNRKEVHVWNYDIAYSKIFAESDLLVTDYSSVAFDFAYLRKPIIYCQFDKEDFFGGSQTFISSGSFDYVSKGLGEVEETLDGTVNRIIEYMQNECKLKDIYRERIDRTFPYNDTLNSERVYKTIKALR